MRIALTFLALLIGTACAHAGESPRDFIKRFYAAYQTWPIRGVPTTEQEDTVSQYLGVEIIRAFRRVNAHRLLEAQQFDPKNPMKPRWCLEGDIFCDNWEGISNYSIGSARSRDGRWVVEANLEYILAGKSHPWTDRLVLDRAGDDWVIADIEYGGGGSLLASLLEELIQADIEIPKTNANQRKSPENKAQMATPRKPSD